MVIIIKGHQTGVYKKAKQGYEMTLKGDNYEKTPDWCVQEG